ncbi:hypothetical protein WISP_62332 [Willisornis vidua]|uniref:Uncharacterized protein n=1 Tax=Willisornis vidua TaxID=1566151 RepID=A0ABQ9DFX1_9PASS|nr:hypothetical protein WISP_62332 [Willisornis vidua]
MSTLASSWDSWRHTIPDAAASFENTGRVSLEEKRQCRKNRSSPKSPKETFCCAFCDRTCLSCISLFSHQQLAASVGRALPKSSFAKPGHDDDDDDIKGSSKGNEG